MGKLAIKGHATRGNEVIEILGILGGSNGFVHSGNNPHAIYYIDEKYKNFITCSKKTNVCDYIIFTLEEFLEKFPNKVGDIVHVNSIDYQGIGIVNSMYWDSENDIIRYEVYSNKCNSFWKVEELQSYKEETTKEEIYKAKAPVLKGEDYSEKRFGYKIPDNYEFDCIKNNEIILKPKQHQYPKIYEECCEVLGLTGCMPTDNLGYKFELILAFYRLLICRNAYWKIAGEQMGLGKPWKQYYDDRCFIIANNKGNIYTYEYHGSNNVILSFPTEKIRDTFYENFKDLIEQCKELL